MIRSNLLIILLFMLLMILYYITYFTPFIFHALFRLFLFIPFYPLPVPRHHWHWSWITRPCSCLLNENSVLSLASLDVLLLLPSQHHLLAQGRYESYLRRIWLNGLGDWGYLQFVNSAILIQCSLILVHQFRQTVLTVPYS